MVAKNPFFLLLTSSMLLGMVVSGEQDETARVKRGAAVYITFPSGGIRPHVEKNPQDFINAVGANNQYSASSGYGGGLLSQYQQSPYGSSSGGSGSSGSGSYGRKKRSANFPNQNGFNFEYNPYLSFDPPSWSRPTQNYETSYSSPIADVDDTPPYSLELPNPVSVSGLLETATSNNDGLAAVFRAYTSRTPYYGLNGSVDTEDVNNTTFNS